MAVCVWPRWEGSAHDTRIFTQTLIRGAQTGDKYYFVDAGYPNTKGYMAPYTGEFTRYRRRTRETCAPKGILWRPRGLLVDQFDSKEDLINAVITSSFIPDIFRNRLCIDGGLTLFMPPTSAAKTVCVCAFPTSSLGLQGIGISPDYNPENRATPRQLFNWALEPAEDSILDKPFELGHLDAAAWAKDNPVEELVQDSCIEDGAIQ